jgi:tRNA A37 threonylcarbamoyltransferase TsaD
VGGVSANTYLNSVFSVFMQSYGIDIKTPVKIEYSTDNAAMIGAAAYWQLQAPDVVAPRVQYIEAVPRMTL